MERNNAMRCLHNEDSDKKAFSGGISLSKMSVCVHEREQETRKKITKSFSILVNSSLFNLHATINKICVGFCYFMQFFLFSR